MINKSRIICFGSDGLASEALKNLVLSGVGNITIVDNAISNHKDLRENFFINKNDVDNSKNRAEAVLKNLLELNEDCMGNSINISIKEFLSKEAIQIQKFDIILSSNNSYVKFYFNFRRKI